MELRHLETLVAIDEEGTFTAAADPLRTVQSNVSEQVRQLEGRARRARCSPGTAAARRRPSSAGGARPGPAIRRELDAAPRGAGRAAGAAGRATRHFGVVGTASRWLVPPLVARARTRRTGRVGCVVNEGASERLLAPSRGAGARARGGHRAGRGHATRRRASRRRGARRTRCPPAWSSTWPSRCRRRPRRAPADSAAGREPAARRDRRRSVRRGA